jgi:hypothetical protein
MIAIYTFRNLMIIRDTLELLLSQTIIETDRCEITFHSNRYFHRSIEETKLHENLV